MAMNRVKINTDVELKDRLVAINRVTKVTREVVLSHSLLSSLSVMVKVLSAGDLVRLVK